jgi:endonuclease YncB( thermonuclease family)
MTELKMTELKMTELNMTELNNTEIFEKFDINTPKFTLEGTKCEGRVVDVYDGDTLTCVLPVHGRMYKYDIRLNGIDTPEIKTKDENEKKKAIEARNFLIRQILCNAELENKFSCLGSCKRKDVQRFFQQHVILVWIHCYEFEKYGRLLADIYPIIRETNTKTDNCLSDCLIDFGHAVKYDGGTKTKWG